MNAAVIVAAGTASRMAGVDKIVFSSTAATYGEPENQPIEESDRTDPTNPYGASKLAIEGMLLTMFDGRTNLAIQVAQEVKRFFPGKVYSTVIPRNIRLSEAPSHGLPALLYDPESRGATSHLMLAKELIDKNRG